MQSKTFLVVLVAVLVLGSVIVVSAQNNGRFSVDDKIKELRDKFKDQSGFAEQIQEQVVACINNTNETCNATNEQAKKIVIGIMKRVCGNHSGYMDRLRNRIQNSQKLTDEEKENLTTMLQARETEIYQICEGLDENSTREEVRNAFREVKSMMNELKLEFRVQLGLLRSRRVGLILERADHLSIKLERFLDSYNGSTENLSNLTELFNEKILEAKMLRGEMDDYWNQAFEAISEGNFTEVNELRRMAHEKHMEANEALKEAQRILRQIIQEIRPEEEIEEPEEPETNETENNETENNETGGEE
ncbi:MAG: hypothetical protein JSW08_01365 [archaeon]|nr:MAG: hypothetical protein JSW08_01365 [archaeon]